MNKLRVTLIRSRYGRYVSPLAPIMHLFRFVQLNPPSLSFPLCRNPQQTQAIRCVGLTKIRQSRVVNATPSMLGNLTKIVHLIQVEPVTQDHV